LTARHQVMEPSVPLDEPMSESGNSSPRSDTSEVSMISSDFSEDKYKRKLWLIIY